MPNLLTNEMQRGINWDQVVQNTVDQYDDPVHGVQKDAIQNGKDAIPRQEKNEDGTLKTQYVKNNWKFSFELAEIRPSGEAPIRALIITDLGTTGLTGEDRVEDFSSGEEIPLDEKWARFEAYAMANEGGQTLGARGQGKFVFIWASKQKKIIYDTRKINGKYRVGYTLVSGFHSPVFAWDGEEGEDWIRKNCGLEPIYPDGNSGTRIIIVDPNEYLIKRLESGEFLDNINETWWPFIRDYNARVEVTVNGITSVASVPDVIKKIYEGKDSTDLKLWNEDGLKFKFGRLENDEFTIKDFRIASFAGGGLPNAYRGIAVFRGSMKIQTVEPLFGYDFEDRISGYVLLDSLADEKLREVEKPSHYEFKPFGIWKKLKSVIEEESQKFGAKKLGVGINKPTNPDQKRQIYVSKALQIFRFLSKDWPLNLTGKGPGPGPGPVSPPTVKKNIYVSIKDFIFPNPANVARLDWGQSVSGWSLEVGNSESRSIKLLLECNAFSLSGQKLLNFAKKEILLSAYQVYNYTGKGSGLELIARQDIFSGAGMYKIVASISDLRTKKIVDEVTRYFWVEMDPPPRAPFDMKDAEFSVVLPDHTEKEWQLQFNEEGIIVYYNIEHPSFIEASKNESQDIYLGEIAGMAGLQLLIRNINTIPPEEIRLKKLPFNYNLLFGSDPVERYLETVRMHDLIRQKILSNYLT